MRFTLQVKLCSRGRMSAPEKESDFEDSSRKPPVHPPVEGDGIEKSRLVITFSTPGLFQPGDTYMTFGELVSAIRIYQDFRRNL
jgi:hypothetical protein